MPGFSPPSLPLVLCVPYDTILAYGLPILLSEVPFNNTSNLDNVYYNRRHRAGSGLLRSEWGS